MKLLLASYSINCSTLLEALDRESCMKSVLWPIELSCNTKEPLSGKAVALTDKGSLIMV